MMNQPELLSPAGNMEALKAAVHFGADAVYGGMKRFGLRAFAGNFDAEELEQALRITHGAGKRFYLTMNSFPFDDELEDFVRAAGEAYETGVDAVIVSDPGAIRMLRRRIPKLAVHVSTQANTLNTPTAEMYREMGCERIILAREMSLERIAALKKRMGETIQVETFVHGASCMAYSGRCLMSAWMTGRSANRGECAQPCRWHYAVMEEKRPGEYYPVAEDERGTYLFSARDLCLMPLLPALVEAGVSSLKIEGRMKTEYYVAVVTGAYRRGLDALKQGREAFDSLLPSLTEELACASHRESDTGFLLGAPEVPGGAEGFHQEREYKALAVSDSDGEGLCRLKLKNRIFAGEELELMTAEGIRFVQATAFLREKTGEMTDTLGVGGEIIRMQIPGVKAGDMLRGEVRNHRI